MATDIDEKLLDEILTDLEKARSWTLLHDSQAGISDPFRR